MANKICRYCEAGLVKKEFNSVTHWFCPTCKWIFDTVLLTHRCVHCGVDVGEGNTICESCVDIIKREWGL